MANTVVAYVPDFAKAAAFQAFLYTHVKILRTTPVLIYTRSKVGSTSVLVAVRKHFPLVLQYHNLLPEAVRGHMESQTDFLSRYNRWHGIWMYREVIAKKRPVKIISLVREPVAHALSHFFHNLDPVMKKRDAHKHFSVEELQAAFINKHLPEMGRVNWFKSEMQPALGINIYDHPFPPDEGHLHIHADNLDVLLLKTEISNKRKEDAIAAFLGLSSFVLERANEGSSKDYGSIYEEFKQQLILPQGLLESIYSEPYSQYFYTPEERAALIEKWTRLPSAEMQP